MTFSLKKLAYGKRSDNVIQGFLDDLQKIVKTIKEHGLIIIYNINKTKMMMVTKRKQATGQLVIIGKTIQQIRQYKYLDTLIKKMFRKRRKYNG